MKKRFQTLLGAALSVAVVLSFTMDQAPQAHAHGDDLVGSLPIQYPHESSSTPTVDTVSGIDEEAFVPVDFVMRGTMRDVEAMIVDAVGVGYIQVETTDDPEVFNYAFHGNVSIDLDRRLLLDGKVELYSRTGIDYLHAKGSLSWHGKKLNVFKVKTTELRVPYIEFLASGAADNGAIGIQYFKPKTFPALATFQAGVEVVRINSITK